MMVPNTLPPTSMASMGPPMGSMPPGTMPPGSMGAAPFGPGTGQYMPNVSRPQMTAVANPPVVYDNIQYGPSYKMQYAKRSTADKTAVKYTGFLHSKESMRRTHAASDESMA